MADDLPQNLFRVLQNVIFQQGLGPDYPDDMGASDREAAMKAYIAGQFAAAREFFAACGADGNAAVPGSLEPALADVIRRRASEA